MKPFFLAISLLTFTLTYSQQEKTIIAYFAGNVDAIKRYDPTKLTHIIFSFCHLKGARLSVDNANDTLRIQRLVRLKKKNPRLQVLLSLGGWGGCETCSDVFATAEGRNEFARSVKQLNEYFDTDGIDLDWEYPVVPGYPGHKYQPSDREAFTQLVIALRKELGPSNEISFAAGGFQRFVDEAIDWQQVMPLIDRVNLMSYDLVHGYSTQTGHHTALYSTSQQPESADNAIKALLKKGVPSNKIVMGAAFYARVWGGVPPSNNGLYQPGKFKTSIAYRSLDTAASTGKGFKYYWDSEASAPYMYNASDSLFVTYDNTISLQMKMKYIHQHSLNGIMFWELSHDLSKEGLLDAIYQFRKPKRSVKKKTSNTYGNF